MPLLPIKRRSFLQVSATAALGCLGNLSFLAHLPKVSAAETSLGRNSVQFDREIEPLVRLIETTPEDKILEEIALKIRKGLSYRELVTALFLAGVRNIQPRPVGFKFHAVLVINSAHLASLASADSDRWLPIFWAINQFKKSQAADVREGDWTLGKVEEARIPPSHKARTAFIEAMDNWDEAAADAAITGLVRTASAQEIFELLARYGVRDFREIGHKEIYVANSFRTLEVMGWQHAEPVLRSVTYALLDRDGERANPARADLPADWPYRHNLKLVGKIPASWVDGKQTETTQELLEALRGASPEEASETAVRLLTKGASPASLFAAMFNAAGEWLMRAPGILSLHAATFTNATHYSWQRVRDDETRRMLLLQNASFLPLFRPKDISKGQALDKLEPIMPQKNRNEAVEEIFAELKNDRLGASKKILGYLMQNNDAQTFAAAARRLIFLKGQDSHDYKFSSAVLEDYQLMPSPWRERYLASSAFYFKGTSDPDNTLVQRIRNALQG